MLTQVLQRPRGTRLFHQLAIVILTTSSLAYFSMASDLGATGISTEFRADGETRQIWVRTDLCARRTWSLISVRLQYVRYIQWFITFPLLLLSVLLATGLSLSDIVTALFMSMVVVISGLVGALVHSDYKWGYFTFGCVALFYVW